MISQNLFNQMTPFKMAERRSHEISRLRVCKVDCSPSSVLLFSSFLVLSKHGLLNEYHIPIWQVSPQPSCSDTCQIWTWHIASNRRLSVERGHITINAKLSSCVDMAPVFMLMDYLNATVFTKSYITIYIYELHIEIVCQRSEWVGHRRNKLRYAVVKLVI